MGCFRGIGCHVWWASHCLNRLVSSALSDPNFFLRATALQLFGLECHACLHHAKWKRASCLALPGTGEHPDDIPRHFLQHGLQIEHSAEDWTADLRSHLKLSWLELTAEMILEVRTDRRSACLKERIAHDSTQGQRIPFEAAVRAWLEKWVTERSRLLAPMNAMDAMDYDSPGASDQLDETKGLHLLAHARPSLTCQLSAHLSCIWQRRHEIVSDSH